MLITCDDLQSRSVDWVCQDIFLSLFFFSRPSILRPDGHQPSLVFKPWTHWLVSLSPSQFTFFPPQIVLILCPTGFVPLR